jgi:hypothetical protein
MVGEILEEEEKDELGKHCMAPLVCPPEVANNFSLTIFPLEEIIKSAMGAGKLRILGIGYCS